VRDPLNALFGILREAESTCTRQVFRQVGAADPHPPWNLFTPSHIHWELGVGNQLVPHQASMAVAAMALS